MTSGRVIRKGTKRQRLFPYRYARLGLQADLESVVLDGAVHLGSTNRSAKLVRLETRDWDHLSLTLQLRAPSEVLSDVLVSSEIETPPVEFLVAIRCDSTFHRTGVTGSAQLQEGDLRGEIDLELERRDFRGTIELTPYLIRTSDAETSEPGVAAKMGSRLASARAWEIRVDPKSRSKTQHLDINFVRFSQQKRFRDYKDRLYWLSADAETPILWLNQDHAKVARALNSEGTVGVAARIRDVFFDLIASSVWVQLFVRAASAIDENGETTFEWHDGVLEELLPELFPEMDRESRRLEARRRVSNADELPQLLHEVDLVLQGRYEYARHMSALVRDAWEQ
jgi:hypothetical protein